MLRGIVFYGTNVGLVGALASGNSKRSANSEYNEGTTNHKGECIYEKKKPEDMPNACRMHVPRLPG
jgi:hypothetical protein